MLYATNTELSLLADDNTGNILPVPDTGGQLDLSSYLILIKNFLILL